jgi:hypothetical protein
MRRAAEVRAASTKVAAAAEVRASTEMRASARVATATGVRTTAMLCEKGSRESRGRQNQRYGDQTGHRVECTTVFRGESCQITSTARPCSVTLTGRGSEQWLPTQQQHSRSCPRITAAIIAIGRKPSVGITVEGIA